MKTIDLHAHSNASDGTLTPSEVIRHAMEQKLSAIALTDHDTLNGVAEACKEADLLKSQGYSIEGIPGIELSANYENHDIHIVGLYVKHTHKGLNQFLDETQSRRIKRNEQMIQNFQNAGIPMTMEDLMFGNKSTIITRAHFAKYLLNHGYVETKQEAFNKYLDSTTPFYVPKVLVSPKEAIFHIHQAGGVAILAHPMLYKMKHSEIETMIVSLKEIGLDGIECLYSTNSTEDNHFLNQMASRYDLLMSGGSDFHGANKPDIELGIGHGNLVIPYELLDQIKQRRDLVRSK